MARKARFRRKDLRRPDEFVTLTTRALQYLGAHARPLGWAAATAAAIAIATFALFSFRGIQERQAGADLSRAVAAFDSRDYATAATLFDQFIGRWSSSPSVPFARLYAGQANLLQANYDKAAIALHDALGDLPDGFLRQAALVALGHALEGQKDYTGAAVRFGEAAAISGPYSAVAVLGQARAQDLAGDAASAQQTLTRFLEKFPDSPEAARVRAQAGGT